MAHKAGAQHLEELVAKAKVHPLYQCRVAAPVVENGTLKGVILESKQERHAILATSPQVPVLPTSLAAKETTRCRPCC